MIARMLPKAMPVITYLPVVLRAFRGEDAAEVQSVASDPLIPLITTVPASGSPRTPAPISTGSGTAALQVPVTHSRSPMPPPTKP